MGGTCLNVGCIPSKALLNNSHLFHISQTDMANRGIEISNVSLNLQKMMKHKEKTVTSLTRGIEMLFKQNKVNYVKGHGKIVSPNEIAVIDGNGKIVETIKAKNIIIATGSDSMSFKGLNVRLSLISG